MKSALPASLLSVLSAALCLLLAAPAQGLAQTPAQEMTVGHAQGETVLKETPKRIVVFDLAALDTLQALGVPVTGVEGQFFPEYLSEYRDDKYLKVGSLFEPDYEAVNAAEPDLIIVGGRSAPAYDKLSEIAPTIDLSVDEHDYLASAIENAKTLGKIFGKEDAVDAQVSKLKASIAALKEQTKDAGHGLIVLTTGGHLSAYGPGSRFGILHDEFGIAPSVKDLDPAVHGQAVSFEFLSKTDPDWLFVIDRDAAIDRSGQAAQKLLDNELVRKTTAWKKGQVVYLDPVNWYLIGGGLTSLQRKVDEVATAMSETR